MAAIVNRSKRESIASDAEFATSMWSRFRGLMLRDDDHFVSGQALVIDPCTSIHMFFMRFPIDVLYLNRDNEVVRAQRRIKPWRIGPLYTRGARFVIELPAGTIERSGTEVGDSVAIGAPGSNSPDALSGSAS
jgi:hypothetical protein